jgi:hypothetical protein
MEEVFFVLCASVVIAPVARPWWKRWPLHPPPGRPLTVNLTPPNALISKNTLKKPFVFERDTHFAQCLQGVNG